MFGRAVGLYVHVPFCAKKCAYCDFASAAGESELHEPFVEALLAEIRGWLATGAHWDTVFVGGGTPTCLEPGLLQRVLFVVGEGLVGAGSCEVTVEANPGTVNEEYLARLVRSGVNRLSFGVQTFHERELRLLGRIHSAQDVDRTLRIARTQGVSNLNLDLIYGLPGQTVSEWRASLERALGYRPEHLSLYALSLEEHTPLWRDVQAGRLPTPDDDLAADMYLMAEERLESAGYDHYELSNWAASPRYRCGHNLKYWRLEPYVGVGAAAHSFAGRRRWWNVRSARDYIERMGAAVGDPSAGSGALLPRPAMDGETELSTSDALGELVFLGMRTSEGIASSEVESRFGVSLLDAYGERIRRLADSGLVQIGSERVCLTQRGRLLGNRVFSEFVSDPDVELREAPVPD